MCQPRLQILGCYVIFTPQVFQMPHISMVEQRQQTGPHGILVGLSNLQLGPCAQQTEKHSRLGQQPIPNERANNPSGEQEEV